MSDKRWYEEDPQVEAAVKAWEKLPPSLQVVIAEFVSTRMQQSKAAEVEAREQGEITEMSSKQVLGMYMTGQKRRWHDDEPVIRSAMNAMAVANRTDQLDVAQRILKVQNYVADHLEDAESLPDELIVAMVAEAVDKILYAKG